MKHFELAAKVALLSRCTMRHGVVIAKGSRVLSLGINSTKTHPRARKIGNTIHAELSALIASNTDIRGATLYSARVLKSGELGKSKPCKWCAELLLEYGLRTVVYCGIALPGRSLSLQLKAQEFSMPLHPKLQIFARRVEEL